MIKCRQTRMSDGIDMQRAFSLLELMVTIAVLAIVVAVAYPTVVDTLYAWESKRTERMFVEVLRQAKVDSFTGKYSVVICSVAVDDQGVNCDRQAQGKVVLFSDYNQNAKLDQHEQVLYEQSWRLRFGSIRLHAGNREYVRYYGSGKPRGHFGHLKYCSYSPNPRYTFKVVFNQHGRVTVRRQSEEEVGC